MNNILIMAGMVFSGGYLVSSGLHKLNDMCTDNTQEKPKKKRKDTKKQTDFREVK